jgi:hypothetical protein
MRIHRLKAELEREKTALTNLRRRQQHKRQVARSRKDRERLAHRGLSKS